jgi:two-component system chemotaxis response regulator CheY
MNLRVLVVDDSSTMRRIIVNVLTQLGISTDYISEAEDGLVALGKVKTNSYDVILTDWNMPRMNGLQFVQNIRKLPKYTHTPILMITTEGGKSEVIEALKSGVNNYIVKPFNAEVLKGKLEPILNRHKK